jgi:signal peptidase I
MVLAWLPTLVATGASILLAILLVRPFFGETIISSGNAMAPTIMGKRWTGVCSDCGAEAFAASPYPPEEVDVGDRAMVPLNGICGREMKSCEVENAAPDPSPSDRVFVAKWLHPKRWDVVAFRSPQNPTRIHIQRLVGLPGETVQIDDGAVWIDGRKLTPPSGQHYVTEISDFNAVHPNLWGSKARPAQLGSDEFFVLGDFSENAIDSRLWQTGATGHSPYAVPQDHIIGVVTHVYWPVSRWRVFR